MSAFINNRPEFYDEMEKRVDHIEEHFCNECNSITAHKIIRKRDHYYNLFSEIEHWYEYYRSCKICETEISLGSIK